MFWIRIALSAVLTLLFLPCLFFAGTSLLMGCLLLAGLAFMLSVVVFPLSVGSPSMRLVRVALLIAVAVFGFLSRKTILREMQSSLNRMAVRLDRTGPRGLTSVNKAGLYGFSMAMGVGGLAVYPEVAIEHLWLHHDGPQVRRWNSSFPLQAKAVRAHLAEFASRLTHANPKTNRLAIPEETFAFEYGKDPWRVALALNPVSIRGEAVRKDGVWVLYVSGLVPVRYPRESRVSIPIPHTGELTIQEGLFHALQQAGWLYPYLAEYRWKISVSDLLEGAG
jgi:hypothetical protein